MLTKYKFMLTQFDFSFTIHYSNNESEDQS